MRNDDNLKQFQTIYYDCHVLSSLSVVVVIPENRIVKIFGAMHEPSKCLFLIHIFYLHDSFLHFLA